VDQIPRPVDKIKQILGSYKDRYLADSDNFPGGCIFVNLTVELSDQRPHLAQAVNEGFIRF
jgi:TetR/AcrR family transcriptional regulator, transcriptional repressor for nem operon